MTETSSPTDDLLSSAAFARLLVDAGYRFFAGVPCSVLRGTIHALEEDPAVTYVPAAREDAAAALAAGAEMAGSPAVVLLQNSGLGNLGDILFSLQQTYRIPLLMVITWRGVEHRDEVQHWVWGDRTEAVLAAYDTATVVLERGRVAEQIREAVRLSREERRVVALLVRRGEVIHEAA